MKKIVFDGKYFNPTDTLECGQIFRFFEVEKSRYLVISGERACEIYSEGDSTIVLCEDDDQAYFRNYFDLDCNYEIINSTALNSGIDILAKAATLGRGVRILRQNSEEMLYSFVVSQNNNIPRIKSIINRMCFKLGEKKYFNGKEFYTFPSSRTISVQPVEFFAENGFGYRASYMKEVANAINGGLMERAKAIGGNELKKELLKIKGIGPKVADCACLFGFYKTDSFPVDVWIEKVYKENFGGTLTDRKKIALYFEEQFKANAGYFQQYLFYYKRTLESRSDK